MKLVFLTILKYIRRKNQKDLLFECSNSDSTVTNEVSVGMSTRQIQDLLTNVMTTVRPDILTMAETKFQDIVKLMETNNSILQAKCLNLRSDSLMFT